MLTSKYLRYKMEEKKADIFIKIDEYKEVLDVLELLKHKISQARAILRKINELKNQEDAEIEDWSTSLDDIEKKISFIDKSLLEPENV